MFNRLFLTVRRAQLKRKLKHNTMLVTFTKQNGEERVMFCSTNPQFLPEPKEVKPPKPVKHPGDAMPVWDLEKDAWRSFRVDSVKHVEQVERI